MRKWDFMRLSYKIYIWDLKQNSKKYKCLSRIYDPSKQYTTVKRSTIGKLSADDPTKMRPNDELLAKRRAIQSEELMKAIAESPRSYNEILQYIKGETSDDSDAEA